MFALRVFILCVAVASLGSLLVTVGAYAWRWWTWIPSCADDESLAPAVAARALLAEWLALTWLLLIHPLGWMRRPHHSDVAPTDSVIVLIHGWGLNAASLWCLRRRLLQRAVASVRIFSYPSRRLDVERAAEHLRDLLVEIQHQRSAPIILVGCGVGGLVARYCLRRHPVRGVRRLITFGTPHHGTSLARYCPGAGPIRPDSPLMRRLNAADHVPDQFDVVAISSGFDAIVSPAGNAEYSGAFNIQIRDVGHFALLFSPRVFPLLVENLSGLADNIGTGLRSTRAPTSCEIVAAHRSTDPSIPE